MKKILAILFLLLISINGYSTHLVGGTLHYEYLGEHGVNTYQYRVVVTIYRDCLRGRANYDPFIAMCVFKQGSKKYENSFNIDLDSFVSVDPVENSNCPLIANNVCLQKATYTKIIQLPASKDGYILKWERCCRNEQVNLPNQNGGNNYGQSYLGYIPSTSIVNSSPYFTEVPVPFMCLNDTTQMKNFAIDPDGDSLVYSLIKPNAGALRTAPNGGTNQRCDSTFVLKKVVYTTGFSEIEPFGSGGYSVINQATGLTNYMSKREGNFSVAVEVKEYRNNKLLGTSILDLQVLVFKCELNAKPQFGSGFKQSFEIDAGDKLCFNFSGVDLNPKDSITIKAFGDLFTGANGFKGTTATFTKKSDTNKVISQFCWATDCNQGRSQPYTFNLELMDNGCPPKSNNQTVSIKVNPFVTKIEILGDSIACEGEFAYWALNGKTNSTYKWNIEGGTILSGHGTDSIMVKWNLGSGKIKVRETAKDGCIGKEKEKEINIKKFVSQVEIIGDSITCEGEFLYYAIKKTPGSNIWWDVEGGTLLSSNGTDTIRVKWEARTGKIRIKETTKNGCFNITKEKTITIKTFLSDVEIIGDSVVCDGEFKYLALNGKSGSNYYWEVEGGILVSGQGTDSIKVKWKIGIGTIKIKEITKNGCSSSTNKKTIHIIEYVSNIEIIGDSIACDGTFGYIVINGNIGSIYIWEIEGGTLNDGQSTDSIIVKWNLGSGKIKVKELNAEGCTSAAKEKPVVVSEFKSQIEIIGESQICEGKTYTYSFLEGEEGSTYKWEIEGGTIISGIGTKSIKVKWTGKPVRVSIQETNKHGCKGPKIETTVSNYNDQDLGYFWGNVITPNNDGKNDCFEIYGLSPECNKLEIKIVNRWGQILYKSKDLNNCWNGRINNSGELVASGTYYYVLKLEIDGGQTIDSHGTVTVLY